MNVLLQQYSGFYNGILRSNLDTTWQFYINFKLGSVKLVHGTYNYNIMILSFDTTCFSGHF